MSINFASPVNTDLASGVLAQLRENISSILTQTQGSGTNIPTGTMRLNPTSGVPEYYNGSTWAKIYFSTAASGGSANAQTISVGAGVTGYQDGMKVYFPIGFLNTGSATLSVNGIGAITLYDANTNGVLLGGELVVGGIAECVYYSAKIYLLNPAPVIQTWSPTPTGFSSIPTNTYYGYTKVGRVCTVFVRNGANGTSDATTYTIPAPFTAATITNAIWGTCLLTTTDNGTDQAVPGIAIISSGGTVFNLYKTTAGGAWTAALGKRGDFQLTYITA